MINITNDKYQYTNEFEPTDTRTYRDYTVYYLRMSVKRTMKCNVACCVILKCYLFLRKYTPSNNNIYLFVRISGHVI